MQNGEYREFLLKKLQGLSGQESAHADAITRTSMPPLHLTEVNFQALYEQRLAELQQQQQGAANGNGNTNGSDSGIILPASATRQ